jgi:hypothetical protein
MDECDLRTKRVPENADGTPERSMLRQLAEDPGNEIDEEAPGRYRSRGHVPYPRG